MKNIYKILLFPLLFVPLACTDLKVLPTYGGTDAVVFKDAANYKAYLAKIYASFSLTGQQGADGLGDISVVTDVGFTSYIRAYWKAQQLTTDETVIAWQDAGIQDLHNHEWSSQNQFVRVLYYRIFYIIAYSNDFLEQSSDSRLDTYGIGAADKEAIKRYRAEVRFLRALAYWHALDLFKNVPLLRKISADLPIQATPEQLFNFIQDELIECEADMADPMANEYGRADKAANWMLRAKLNLNAEVHIGVPKYTEAIAQMDKILASGYKLADKYKDLFLADNHKESTTELIFTLPADGIRSQSYGSTTFLVHAMMGPQMIDNTVNGVAFAKEGEKLYGVASAWAGLRTTKNMLLKFGDTTNFAGMDPRGMFFTEKQSIEIEDQTLFQYGIVVPKFKNITSDGKRGSNNNFVDTDYPLFRLGDIYLMYAEALVRSGSDLTKGVDFINKLRERAYGNSLNNISAGDLTLEFILDERTRELYWEGHRRIDLIRFGAFSTHKGSDVPPSYTIWPWKGGVKEGKQTSSFLDIFPIPASDKISNPNLVQNTGY